MRASTYRFLWKKLLLEGYILIDFPRSDKRRQKIRETAAKHMKTRQFCLGSRCLVSMNPFHVPFRFSLLGNIEAFFYNFPQFLMQYFVFETFSVSRWSPYGSVLLWECFSNYADLTVEILELVWVDLTLGFYLLIKRFCSKNIGVSLFWSPIRKSRVKLKLW